MRNELISLEGVSVEQLRLLNEDILVRPAAAEEERASGLVVPNAPSQNLLGGVFYGTAVKAGPGRVVREAPPAEAVANIARIAVLVHHGHKGVASLADLVADAVRAFVEKHERPILVPPPAKAGDRVVCRQGFGPEVHLREGRHHVVGRGNAEHGHGVLATYSEEHVHCWHWEVERHSDTISTKVQCACGEARSIGTFQTRLPSCSTCPPGERLAEAVLGGEVVRVEIPTIPSHELEERPVLDDGTDGL